MVVNNCGVVFDKDWVYCNWEVDWSICADLHINNKENLVIVLACLRWAPRWRNKRVIIKTDNQAAMSIVRAIGLGLI